MTRSERPLEIEMTFSPGTYDIDYAGIVSNIVYIRWLEDLRLALLNDYLPLEGELAQGVTPVLVKTEIHYVRPVRLFESVGALMWVTHVAGASWSLEAEFVVQEVVTARAKQVLASVSLHTFRPRPLPKRLRELYEGSSSKGDR